MTDPSLKQLFDIIPESVLITDEKGLVVYTNPAMSDRTGFAVAEIVGKRSGTLWGGHMDKEFYKHFWKKITERQEPFIGQVSNQYKDNQLRRETISVAPILDEAKKVHYFIELIPKEHDRTFYDTFEKLFSDQIVRHNDIIKWITHVPQKDDISLANTITSELVFPMQEQFASRFEDRTLIQAAQTSASAFSELYLKYKSDIKRYFLYHIANPDEAEDFTQETFIRAFRFLPHFTISNASYLTYLKRIAHNLAANYYRDKKTTVQLEDIQEQITADASFLDQLFNKEMAERLLSSLTDFERELVTQRYIEGLPMRDIATNVGKTENAVKLILSRLRKKIKNS